jgi:hypothetical protein
METLDPHIKMHREALCALASLIDSTFYDVLELSMQQKNPKDEINMVTKEDIARSMINDISLHARFVKNNPQACRLLQIQEDASLTVDKRKKERKKQDGEMHSETQQEGEREEKKLKRVGPKRRAKSKAEQEMKENILMEESDGDDDEYVQEEGEEDDEEDEEEDEEDEETEADKNFVVNA